ncbi:MAG: tRNA adenosine(34) deaminase TadA [Cyanobacteria bacterium J06643_4]
MLSETLPSGALLSDALLSDVLPYGIEPPAIDNEIYLRHRAWMLRAIALAETAGNAGEVPVAAIVVGPDNRLLAEATNRKERDGDPTGHAEVLALRAAGKQLGNWHLTGCVLYVTLEPCMMCAGAIVHARVAQLVYGADDFKTGAVRSVLNLPDSDCSNHKLDVLAGILEAPCRQQLQAWFQQRRQSRRAEKRQTEKHGQ